MTNGNNRNTFLAGIAMDLIENSPHSPTDSSEDSVEVKVEAIAFRSKRKLTEPRRLHDGPLKKRACIRAEEAAPFRPWSLSPPKSSSSSSTSPPPTSTTSLIPEVAPPPRQYFRPPSPPPQVRILAPSPLPQQQHQQQQQHLPIRIPIHPKHTATSGETDAALTASGAQFPKLQRAAVPAAKQDFEALEALETLDTLEVVDVEEEPMCEESCSSSKDGQRKEQRNYKNMTRERRIEANARERTRVHTISAAFDTLRHAVPAYSHSQKLSKLSVLRIACSYIMTLSNILEDSPDVAESVENVSRTIQREGKLRKKKDE